MAPESDPGNVLRLEAAEGPLQVPGAPFALAAKLIERYEFPAIYLSGAAFSTGMLGLPDVGLFTLTELAQHTATLTKATSLPVIVDADTGFGEAINVERVVVELEAVGAAAIQLEDQIMPKRCGHLSGKAIVDCQTMCAKLRAASAGRSRQGTVVLARTDARAVTGLDDAIERAKRYLEAGADWIFPEALEKRDEFERFAQQIDAPLVASMTEFGKSPLLTFDELAELGYAVVIYPVSLQQIAMRAMEAALAVIQTEGTQNSLLDLMQTREELYDLLDYEDFDRRDREYFSIT